MLRQTCRSLSSVEDVEITLFRDARLHLREPKSFGHSAPTRVVPIHNDGQLYLYLRSEPGKHDATILIAPDDALYMVWNHVRHCGGNIFISGREFLLVACSKHATSRWLQAYGVRAPRGIVLKRNTPLAVNFRYPAIIKPVYGCGSQGVRKVEGPDDAGLDDAWRAECAYQDLRLEQFIPGQPASVGAIVGMIETVFLPPCFQRIDSQNNFDYCGGALIEDLNLVERAHDLAAQALAALPPALGYVGFDIIFGEARDGSQDYVIEVNPRFTTSFAALMGHVAGPEFSLMGALIDLIEGRPAKIRWKDEPLSFAVDEFES